MTKITQAGYSNVEPGATAMSTYELLPGGRAEYLHAIVACAEQKRAQNIDNKMDPGVQPPSSVAIAFEQSSDGAI